MKRRRASIVSKKLELDRLRPRVLKSLAALDEWYDVELTYTSNAIEGNTLTRIETAVVLEKGLTIGGKPLKDHLEAVGHKEALDFIRSLAENPQQVHEVDVRAIHRLVLERADPREAGKYSDHQRAIKGSSVVLPSPWEIAASLGNPRTAAASSVPREEQRVPFPAPGAHPRPLR